MSKQYEFSVLTPEAYAAYAAFSEGAGVTSINRMKLAAFLRAVLKIATGSPDGSWPTLVATAPMVALANNLHSPPPPPPTLAEAREAARQLAGPCAEVVHAFLSTLKDEGNGAAAQ
jgi:hypothetical protein